MKPTLGALTIGQAPRVDIMPELYPLLARDVTIVEAGALDNLTPEQILQLAPGPDDEVLVTRLRDGTGVRVAKRHIIPRLQQRIDELTGEVGVFLLLCTGTFPPFRGHRPILYPDRILLALVRAVGAKNIGVITPDAGQVEEQQQRWGQIAARVTVRSCSPYDRAGRLPELARGLGETDPDLIVLDSLGYTQGMKALVRQESGRRVLLPRSVLARVAAELL